MNVNLGSQHLGWLVNRSPIADVSTIVEAFRRCVRQTPDATAVVIGRADDTAPETLTYAELDARAQALARALVANGVKVGARVGFATRRDFDVVTAMLGILMSGAAYVPLDLSYPRQRLEFMQRDSGLSAVLLSAGLDAGFVLEGTPIVEIGAAVAAADAKLPTLKAEDPAYIIYTSGSTGTPKGVVTPHRGVLRLVLGATYTAFGPDRRVLQMAPVSFDAATFEIWGALLNGGACVIYPDSGAPDFTRLRAVLESAKINTLWLTSSLFNAIVDADLTMLSGLDELLVGGEALSVAHVRKANAGLRANLVNGYGPTETTTFACCYRIPRDLPKDVVSIPIGQPIENTSVAILDADFMPVTEGEPGELCIAGDGLALGYFGQPKLTNERFLKRPGVPGHRFYRTGDQVRMLPSGDIEFLGRKDLQVKIGGHRIELGEIEHVLRSHPDLDDAAVTIEGEGDERLIAAWIVPAAGATTPETGELRRYVATHLPKHMVPSFITPLAAMPLTPVGKLDRAALTAPKRQRPELEQAYAAPRGELEKFVAETWRTLIGLDRVGRHDRFFELGGSSLLAMRFLEICRRERDLNLSVAEFFDRPTVENIARIASRSTAELLVSAPRPKAESDRVAIIGLAGRFAGAPDVASFWDMLMAGRTGRVEVTRADLEAAGEDPALLDDPDYVAAAFPLEDAEGFDAAFFGFTPREAELMDPQQRILLEAAWTALEDAGLDPKQGTDKIGVFAGVGRNAYLLNNLMSHEALRESAAEYNMLIGNERDFPSTHIAYRMGLKGPALTVQTACSTSGVAIHMAAESLRRGECDVALAGGAKVLSPNRVGYRYVEGGPLSPDGVLRAFDADANGMVRGSGVAMVALKRLDDALRDGDHVYGVLIGSAVNNDGGSGAGFTAPSVSGQASVIAEAHSRAGVTADTVSMIEAHGTGTVLGDPIEVEGLTRAFRATSDRVGHAALGSVKTNIGHLDAGATAAGLIKAALSLQNEVIPPTLNFNAPNPRIGFCDSPFYVAAEAVEWKRSDAPRRAGISSFGLGGTNAHLLIEEAPVREASAPAKGAQLLVLSARTETALAQRCADLAQWLERHEDINLADVAYTLMVGRRRFEKRVAVVCTDRQDAIEKLRAMTPGQVLRGASAVDAPPVAFLFPGGGSQYAGMARDLYASLPAFREALDDCDRLYKDRTSQSLIALIHETEGALDQPTVALPALFAVEYAMAQVWLAWGVKPEAMIGHSMGEYAAACLAGVFSLEDALDIVMCRGRLFDTLQPGSMLSVPMAAAVVRERLPDDLSIAAINRDDLCVVSGPVDSVRAFAEALTADGIESRHVHINVAAHSTMVEPILAEFRERLQKVSFGKPQLGFLSNLTGDWITDDEATDPEYWVSHLRSTVQFADGVARLLEEPERILLEIGPGQVLSTLVRQNSRRGPDHAVIATIRHPQETASDSDFVFGALGKFWLAGGTLDVTALTGGDRRRTPLPTYPFERTRHWIEAVPFASNDHAASPTGAAKALAAPAAVAEVTYANRRERILAQLKGIIGKLSGLPVEQIDPHATFLELGFDSLFLTQANAAFKKAFKLKLTTRQLIETTPVLDALATYVDATLEADFELGAIEAPAAPKAQGGGGGDVAAPVSAAGGESPGIAKVKTGAAEVLNPVQEAYIDDLIATTIALTPKAKAETQTYRHVLADPRTVQGFRSRWKEMVYPVLSDKALGSKIWDVDGNEYIDLVSGYGVTFLGHQPPFVVDAIRSQVDKTLAIGPQTVLAGEVAELVSKMTGMERVAFCNTGSEAVLAAVRIARTVTGKSKIAKFDGHYHGIFDEMQVRGSGTGSRMSTFPSAPGIPHEAVQNTMILNYGDPEAFDVIRENVDELALVLVEPVRSRNPDFQPREYLLALRKLTEELGIPLLFDEMVTGFRSHPGGAQAIFGIRADMATYGKVAGGGLPIGIVTGSAQYMDALDGGGWQFGDDSVPTADMTWFAGTFVRHPLSLAAAKATLEHLVSEGPELQERLNARSSKLANELNTFLQKVRTPIKVEHFSSVLRVTFTEHQEYADLLFFELRNRGILTYEGRPIFLTTAHSDEDLAAVRDAFIVSINRLIEVGLLDGRNPDLVRQIPMSVGQQEIWVSSQFAREASCSYNLCSTLDLTGAFDLDVFRGALADLSERHEALRTVPDRDGQTQTIRPEMEIPVTVEDGRSDTAAELAARIQRMQQAEVRTPFDLANGPLVRCHIVRQKDDQHLVLLTVHHVIADGWSCGILLRDLGEIYAARKAGRAPVLQPAQQLSDYIAFLRATDQIESRQEAHDYWLKLYSGDFPRIDFPSDRPRPKLREYASERLQIAVEPAVTSALRKVARDSGTTLFASLIGGFAAYVTRLTGSADSPVGFSAAGQPLLGGKDLVGHCVNFLPLRLSTNVDEGFGSHLRGIGASVLDALEHQNFDLMSFVQDIQPQRETAWAPLVSLGVNLDASANSMTFADFGVEAGSVGRVFEHLDLFVNFVEIDADLQLQCTFNTALFDRTTIQKRMEEYLMLLAAASNTPEAALSTLDIVRPADRQLMLSDWNGVDADYPRDASMADLFAAMVKAHPEKAALLVSKTDDQIPQDKVSYAELDQLSDLWAARLQAAGVKRGDFVGVVVPRSLNLVVALLAVLKAGAAYVPVAATMPPAAVRRVMDHSKATALLTTSALDAAAIPDGIAVIAMDTDHGDAPILDLTDTATNGGDPAYVIYTSGSTGTPKGVIVPQRGISRLVLATDYTPLNSERVLLLLAPISFDISMFEIWGALLNGGTVVVPPWDQLPELHKLGDIVKATGVSTLQMTPALFNAIIDEAPEMLKGVEELMIGGEALSVSHTHRALDLLPNTALINVYGPTENAVWSTFNRIPRDFSANASSVSIGQPINNGSAYIVDARMQLVPPGVMGELVVGGDGVALGYLGQAELTDQVFVPDTISGIPGARLYRTGDYCRYLPDGTIEFLGRRDSQVKIRGFRIELGEVEATLQDIEGVRQAVAVHEPGKDGGRLVAFVLPNDSAITGEGLIQRLRERLPRHLVPAQITLVEDLPLSAHGKVDREALLRMQPEQTDVVVKVAPRTELEKELADIWAELLQRPVDSIEDSFFSLGGQSLMAVRLFDRVRRRFGGDLAISALFSHPTIRELAALIQETISADALTSSEDQEQLNARAGELVDELNAFLQKVRAPIKVAHSSAVLEIAVAAHQDYADLLSFELRNHGVVIYDGRPIALTPAHSDEDIAAIRDAFVASINRLIEVGLLDGHAPNVTRQIPMSVGQQELWVSSQFGPEASCSYNLCGTLDLTGAFDLEGFRASLQDLTGRHEALRTVPDRDGLTQTIRPSIEIALTVEDGRSDNAAELAARIERARQAEVRTPFDLANGPLSRCHIVRQKDNQHLVLLTVHHVIADGWSFDVLLRDLSELYAAREANRAPDLQPAQQLSDFIAFTLDPDQVKVREEARDYWLKLYADDFPRIEFPADRPRPKLRDYASERLQIPVEPAVTNALRKVARDSGTTLFASLIGGFAAYLTRLTGAADCPIGFSAAGQPLLGGKDLVGHCVNFLPLRLSTNLDEGFGAHLRRTGTSVMGGLEHQNFDFMSFMQDAQPQRDADWAPLVSMAINLEAATDSVTFADFGVEAGSVGRAYEHLDLFVHFLEVDSNLELLCTFNTALFDRASMQKRMEEYLQLLAAAANTPEAALSSLDIVRPADRQAMMSDWNGVDADYPRDASMIDLFRAMVCSHPDKAALLVAETAGDEIPQRKVSYAELDQLSDAWAARLQASGVKRGDFVGVVVPRSLNLVVALLAVLKAGAAYVPVAATMPDAAVRRVLDHSKATALLTTSALNTAAIPDGISVVAMDGECSDAPVLDQSDTATNGGDPAYVIYTSGSTGTPKGVIVPQRGISRLVLATDYTPLNSDRVLLLLAPISFDISMFEIWGALLNGGTVVVPPWDVVQDLRKLGDIVKATGVSTLQMTPALFNAIIDESPEMLKGVEELMIGGEALSVSHTHRALELLPDTTLINVYGPTENAVWSTFSRIPRDFDANETSVSIGRPINNSSAYVVDAQLRLLPPGVLGELVVGGDGVALGYLSQPELTAQMFVPDTISGIPGARLYRTGDYCRYLPDGTIEFLGRRDNQVKIRGFRIELGEVETTLQDIEGVRQAVAVHEPGKDGGRLVAFVLAGAPTVTGDDLIQRLRERLARHLVPAQITVVEDLPLSAHGKVDREALLRMQPEQTDVVVKVAPRTELEKELADIWAELLQRPVDSIEDSFFSLGGQSLMAVRLFDRIRRRFNADLVISTLFSHPTIRELAALIEETTKLETGLTSSEDQERLNVRASGLVDELNAFLQKVQAPIKVAHSAAVLDIAFTAQQAYADLLFFELRNRGLVIYDSRPIALTPAHTDEDIAAIRDAFIASVNRLIEVGLLDGRAPNVARQIPMSVGQQEIWVSSQFGPEASCSYDLCCTLDLTGAFDLDMFRAALKDLTGRHEALRTIPDRDGLTQTIRPSMEIPLTIEDGRSDSAAELAARIERASQAQVRTPFDLANGPLVRCHIIQRGGDRHLVLLTMHHVIADGWSFDVLLRDLGEFYAARQAGRSPNLQPAQQLSDFIAFTLDPDQVKAREEARDYWLKLYAGDFPRIEFPADRPRPKLRDYSSERLQIPVEPAVTSALRKVAQDSGTSLFSSLIGGFAAYLTRLTGATDSPIGFSAAGQPQLGGKDLVGHCVNFLPLRLSTNLDEGFGAHLRGISASVLGGLEHQNFDFLSFMQEVQPQRDADWAPLVSVAVNLEMATESVTFADFGVEAGSVGRVFEHFDLFLHFVEVDSSLELLCTFNTALFDRATIQKRMEEYLQLLAAAANAPEAALSSLDIVRPEDRQLMLADWNGVDTEYPRDASMIDLFRTMVGAYPDKTALLVSKTGAPIPQDAVSYAELDQLSDVWAARLQAAGVKRGDFVGVVVPRSLELVVGLIAVLKAGAAYVPIAATMPDAAVRRVLDHSKATALLTTAALDQTAMPEGIAVVAMDGDHGDTPVLDLTDTATNGGDPAYVIYTSGSTGTPKGVIVPQRGISRLVLATDYTPLNADRVLLLLAPISFDISMFEIWGALLNGGTVVVPPWDLVQDLRKLGDIVKATGVSTLQMTPALFNAIIDESPEMLKGVEELMIGGEALSVSHTYRALELLPNTTLINVYGPTENAVWSTFSRIPRDFDANASSVSIGRPINNSSAYIVDERMQLVPPGVSGELVVGGDGVALGYLGQPELTAQVFVPDTISGIAGARLYRTGDYSRYLPDGSIEFLGRRDNQVKIRGFRIELGEVEATLQDIEGVRQAVAVHEPGKDGGRLVAFVLPDAAVTPEGLIQRLRERLPRHLVPSQITVVDDLPLSAHGKVDRKALLKLQTAQTEEVAVKVAPRTELEKELAIIWAELLQRPVDSIEDSFFSLGGQSLMAVRLFDRVRRRFGADLAISTLFSHPTIRELAAIIEESTSSETSMAASEDWDTTTVIHPGPGDGSRPLFIVGGAGGNVNNLADLGYTLGRHRMVVGIQTRGVLGHTPRNSIEEMAAENIRYIKLRQPTGPYLLAGYSGGAWTAFEMARQLHASGETVAELILLDIMSPTLANRDDLVSAPIKTSPIERLQDEFRLLNDYGPKYLYKRVSAKVTNFVLRGKVIDLVAITSPTFARSRRSALAFFAAARKYQGGPYDGSVSLVVTTPISARAGQFLSKTPHYGWDELVAQDKITRIQMEGGHVDMVRAEHAESLAQFIEGRIKAASPSA